MVLVTHACSCLECRWLLARLDGSWRTSETLRKRIAAFCSELGCRERPTDHLPPPDRLSWIELPVTSCPHCDTLRERIALAEAERIALAFALFDLGGRIAYKWRTTRRRIGCSLKQLGISPRQLGVSPRQMRDRYRAEAVLPARRRAAA